MDSFDFPVALKASPIAPSARVLLGSSSTAFWAILTALSIDAMLPALPEIGSDLGVQNTNGRQLVVSVIFLGLAVGQVFFGPLSDKTGRKPAIYAGYILYIMGSLLSATAVNFPMMLVGRLLQGIGASAPRAITLALVRDRFEGSGVDPEKPVLAPPQTSFHLFATPPRTDRHCTVSGPYGPSRAAVAAGQAQADLATHRAEAGHHPPRSHTRPRSRRATEGLRRRVAGESAGALAGETTQNDRSYPLWFRSTTS